jgi:hypothetical protein
MEGLVGKLEGYGKNRRVDVGVAGKGARASDWRCREVPALPIGPYRAGARTGAPTHLLGSPSCRRDFGAAGAGRFWPRTQFPRQPRFERRFGVPWMDLRKKVFSPA